MINALFLILSASQQPDEKLAKVLPEFTVTAQTFERTAKSLSEASGLILQVPGALAKEVVFTSLKGQTVKQCMDRLAEAAYGEWKYENGVYLLRRLDSAQTAENEAIAKETAVLAQKIKDKAEELRQPGWSANSAKTYLDGLYKLQQAALKNVHFGGHEGRYTININGPSMAGPAYDLLATVLQNLDVRTLQNLKVGEHAVFSTNPNRMQQPLRMNISQAVQSYVRNMNEVHALAQNTSYPDLGADFGGSVGFPKGKSAPVAKTNVILYRGPSGFVIGVQLVGQDGSEIASTSTNLEPGIESGFESPAGAPPKEQKEPIPYSKLTDEFLAYVKAFGILGGSTRSVGLMIDGAPVFVTSGQAARTINPSPELGEIFTNPTRRDPLSIFMPEMLAGSYKGQNYVAVVPDTFWEMIWITIGGGTSKEEFVELLSEHCQIVTQDGGTVIRPLRPFKSESTRVKREAMERFVGQVYNRGFARVSELAEYATARGYNAMQGSMDMLILGIATPFAAQDLKNAFSYSYWLAPILASQKRTLDNLAEGEFHLPYGKMNAVERNAMEQLIYNEPYDASIASGNYSINVSTEPETRKVMARDSEPTEMFPNGIPADVSVKLTAKLEDGVFGRVKQNRNGRLMSAIQLGAIMGMIDSEGGSDGEFKITAFEEFQLAKIKHITPQIDRGQTYGGASAAPLMVDGEILPGGPYGITQLPAEMIKRIESARAQLRDVFQRMNQGGGGNNVPPPAP